MPKIQIEAEGSVADAKQFTGGGGMLPQGRYVFTMEQDPPETKAPGPNGKYHYTIFKAKVRQVLEIDNPEEQAQAASLVGRASSEVFSHSPKTVGNMKALCEATGVQYSIITFANNAEGIEFDPDHTCGRSFEVQIVHEADNRPNAKYPTQARWRNLRPLGSAVQQPAQGQQAQQPYTPPAASMPAPQQAQAAPPQQGFVPQGATPPPQGYYGGPQG